MSHYVTNCKHGKTLSQCRCPSSNKDVRIGPCPPECGEGDPHDTHRSWAYITTDSPKMLREALSVAQSALYLCGVSPDQHPAVLGRLIDECDRHRPLGSDGQHNDLHTATCGCETINEKE